MKCDFKLEEWHLGSAKSREVVTKICTKELHCRGSCIPVRWVFGSTWQSPWTTIPHPCNTFLPRLWICHLSPEQDRSQASSNHLMKKQVKPGFTNYQSPDLATKWRSIKNNEYFSKIKFFLTFFQNWNQEKMNIKSR